MTAVVSVPDLIRRGAMAPAHIDPVDAVMGEDWAHLELGRGGAARRLGYGEMRRLGARRRRAALGGVLAPNPQSLVKLIGSGGTSSAQGLRAQMNYLSRNGDVPLRASESNFGIELDAQDATGIAAAWGVPEQSRGGADRTSHFVVSFPAGTDAAAAERAGWAWAAELFDSGATGERWDYYTAFHTDTAYPHIHVVVGRRGLDHGDWLRISARSEITFDRLREVQVEMAAREGIALTGTSRLARGVHDRPVPDAEYRRARAEGRAPVAPAHTWATARVAAAEVLEHARVYQGAAETIREARPELADQLAEAAHTLLEGKEIVAARETASHLTTKEALDMARSIAEKQERIRENFRNLDKRLAEIPDPADRGAFLRRLGELKAEAAPLVREDFRLQAYGAETAHSGYRGLIVSQDDPRAVAIKAEADRAVEEVARRYGMDPEATLIRYGAASVSLGLGVDYQREERRERLAKEPGEDPERRDRMLAEFRDRVGKIYSEAVERLRAHERTDPRGEEERDPRNEITPRRSRGTSEAKAREVERPDRSAVAPEHLPEDPPRRSAPRRAREDDDDGRSR